MKIVKVIWKDAICNNEYLNLDDVKKQKLIITETIGYLVDEDNERICVASTKYDEIDGSFTFRDTALIPKLNIVEIKDL